MRFGLGVLAYLRTRLLLTPHAFHGYYECLAIYRKDIIINHTLRLSLDPDPGDSLCLGLPVGDRTASSDGRMVQDAVLAEVAGISLTTA